MGEALAPIFIGKTENNRQANTSRSKQREKATVGRLVRGPGGIIEWVKWS
jgi:hypothetical protein